MSDPRYDDRPPPVVENAGPSTAAILAAVVALLLLGGLFMFYNRDATVASRSTDPNTGSVTRTAPEPAPARPGNIPQRP